jgi:bifunctional non-homologous end joining protein LigD
VNEQLKKLPERQKQKLKQKKQPEWVNPMLAKLTHDYFSDDNWIFERKLDGERCLGFAKGGKIQLKSRNRKILNDAYPEIVAALQKQKERDFIVDGEVVAFEGSRTSFARLQNRMHASGANKNVAVYYYLFDLIFYDGYDLSRLDLRDRKNILKSAFKFNNRLRFTAHRNKEGKRFHKEACRKKWEGLIAKKSDSGYKHGRSAKWLKFKCINRQEFVIGGYTDPEGERIGFGALLIGYYKGNKLIYAGKVGTGYDDNMLEKMSKRLSGLERKTSPFENFGNGSKGMHGVSPRLVGEIGFAEWTTDGKLRHPRFLGLRRDKSPKKVVRESGR